MISKVSGTSQLSSPKTARGDENTSLPVDRGITLLSFLGTFLGVLF